MTTLMSIAIIALCFSIFLWTSWIWHLNRTRRSGRYPGERATLFDVRRLLLQGEHEAAIRLYGQIFRTTRQEAEKAVGELEKSLKK